MFTLKEIPWYICIHLASSSESSAQEPMVVPEYCVLRHILYVHPSRASTPALPAVWGFRLGFCTALCDIS